jgi:hypothetical protein
MDVKEVGWEGVDWMYDTEGWLALLNSVMKLRVPYRAANFMTC